MSDLRLWDVRPATKHAVFLTKDGARKLEAELDELDLVRRPEIADRLRAARDFGDGLENAELLEAKDEMQRLERQIGEIKGLLGQSELIEPRRRKKGDVGLGSWVVVDSEFGKEKFLIVGSVEADPLSNRISIGSPLGSALIGRRAGDHIEWWSPSGRLSAVVDRVS